MQLKQYSTRDSWESKSGELYEVLLQVLKNQDQVVSKVIEITLIDKINLHQNHVYQLVKTALIDKVNVYQVVAKVVETSLIDKINVYQNQVVDTHNDESTLLNSEITKALSPSTGINLTVT